MRKKISFQHNSVQKGVVKKKKSYCLVNDHIELEKTRKIKKKTYFANARTMTPRKFVT